MTQPDPGPLTEPTQEPDWRILAEFSLPSQPGSDRLARERVAASLGALNLPAADLERLKTAVAEATLNAIEHGNRFRPELPVAIRILTSADTVMVSITDRGSGPILPPQSPDLTAKMSGQQSPRGWGFFLIEKMVDNLRVIDDDARHTIELFLYLEGGNKDGSTG